MALVEKPMPHQVLDVYSVREGESPIITVWLLLFPSIHVIHSSSLGVFQNLVRVYHLLEFLLSPRIRFVAVGVILLGSFLEGSFDQLIIGVFRNPENFVGVWRFAGSLKR